MQLTINHIQDIISAHMSDATLKLVGSVADAMHRECYVVGGYVRDMLLGRPSPDMDFVTVGSGIEVARAVKERYGKRAHLSVFKTYGTAQVKVGKTELEFVGARRESYVRDSRNPIVEDGTLHDDQCRRDFTINAMAISLNADTYGKLLDPFDGIGDLNRHIIRTPLDPDITFSDDPLRMMRAVRFATQLEFEIFPETFEAIKRNAYRIEIITHERIAEELMKIVRAKHPSRGFKLLERSGLLKLIFPELDALKGVENMHGRGHKDNFLHTMQVLDNVSQQSDNEWLRWAAVFHDIAKPVTKRWDDRQGWTFHNHNFIGEKMVPKIFARMRLPLNEHMKYVKKLVGLHMRPIAIVDDEVTDSAVRRLLFDAGDDIDDLMTLCSADITSKNEARVQKYRDNFKLVKQKLIAIEEKDRIRNFQPPVGGEEIMETFNLRPSLPVGKIKDAIKDAILDGVIPNDYEHAYRFMMDKAQTMNLEPMHAGDVCLDTLDTPAGTLTIAACALGIVFIGFGDRRNEVEKLAKSLGKPVADASTPLLKRCESQLNEYFEGNRKEFDLPTHVKDTAFRSKAWEALRTIPYGTTITYAEQTERMGEPMNKVRAVAQANSKNPLGIIVPCHRVIGSDGSLTGYAGGLEAKRFLLNLERDYAQQITD